jgi:hypothetical protein
MARDLWTISLFGLVRLNIFQTVGFVKLTGLKFDKKIVSSNRFPSGAWQITHCIENDQIVSIDLGWQEEDTGIEYRHIGIFNEENDADFVIQKLESIAAVKDIKTILSDNGFSKYNPTGFSNGQSTYAVEIDEGLSNAFIEFDPHGNGTRLRYVIAGKTYHVTDIATIQLDTRDTKLATLGKPEEIAVTLLCELVKSIIASG